MSFDPDAYLSAESGKFDPDAYLGVDEPESSAVGNAATVAGQSAVKSTGQAVSGVWRLADDVLGELPQRAGISIARFFGLVSPEQAEMGRRLTEMGVRFTPEGRALQLASESGVEGGKAIESLADVYQPDPARADEFTTQAAALAGTLAPAMVSPGTALPVLAGQMGEVERERALQAGDAPDLADAKFKLGATGGAVLGALPVAPVARAVAGPVERLAVKSLGGAALNAGADVAQQEAIDGEVDWGRVKTAAAFGGAFGLFSALPEGVKARVEKRISDALKSRNEANLSSAELDRIVTEELGNLPEAEQGAAKSAVQQQIEANLGGMEPFRPVDQDGYVRWWREHTAETPGGGRLAASLKQLAEKATALPIVSPGARKLSEGIKKAAPGWFLPKEMKETLRLGEQATRSILSKGGALQKDLRRALKNIEDKEEAARQSAAVQDYLTGRTALESLTPEVRGPAQQVRSFIDGLSDRAVREGVVSGELSEKFTDNLGSYLRRSYRIHADPDYAPKPAHVSAAIEAVQAHNAIPREQAATLINDLIDKHQRAAQMDFLAGRGKLAGKDVSSLVKRKDLLPEIRRLLGEIKDPLENVGETIPRLARLVEHHNTQQTMRDLGQELGIFRDTAKNPLQDQEVGQWVPLVSDSSATHDVWAGLHTRPEIRAALEKTAGSGQVSGLRGLTWRLWRGGTGVAKTSKTILNPDSYAPNFIGGIVSGAANGNFRVDQLGRGLKLGLEEGGVLRWLQSKGLMAKDRAGLQDEIAKLTRLGLRGENLAAADLQATLERSVLAPLAEKTIKPLQNIYGATDDLTKYVAWKSEMGRYARAFPEMPRAELEQLAADVVRDTMPTYSQVPKVLREASQLGLSPTFVNFTYEVFRNTANTVRIGQRDLRAGLATGNRQLVRAGAERLAAVTAALGLASTWGWAKMSRADKGVTDEQDEAVRFFGPPWNKNGQLIYNTPIDAEGKVQFSNQSYLLPQALLFEAVGEGARARNPEEMANAFLGALGQQFLGIENSVVLSTVLDAARGVDATGRRVINPESPSVNRDRVDYVVDKAFKPVFLDKLKRMKLAYTNQLSETGRAYSLTEEGKRLAGIRAQTLDTPQAAVFKARQLGQRFKDATSIYRRVLKRNVTPEDKQKAYEQSEQSRLRVFADLQDYYRYGRAMHVPEDDLIENLRKAGMPTETILGMLDGHYVAGEKDTPETVSEIFARIRALPAEKRQAALRAEAIKDPAIVRSLINRTKEEAKGLTGRDKLVRSLGVNNGERADYLRRQLDALPDLAARKEYLLDLARKGVVTEKVLLQLVKE